MFHIEIYRHLNRMHLCPAGHLGPKRRLQRRGAAGAVNTAAGGASDAGGGAAGGTIAWTIVAMAASAAAEFNKLDRLDPLPPPPPPQRSSTKTRKTLIWPIYIERKLTCAFGVELLVNCTFSVRKN